MKRLLLCSALALSACAQGNTERDFLCGAQDGQPCRSISEVDGRATRAQSTPAAPAQTAATAQTRAGNVPGTGVRIAEKTGRMFVAPHMGTNGLVHEGSTVQFVVRSARWQQS